MLGNQEKAPDVFSCRDLRLDLGPQGAQLDSMSEALGRART